MVGDEDGKLEKDRAFCTGFHSNDGMLVGFAGGVSDEAPPTGAVKVKCSGRVASTPCFAGVNEGVVGFACAPAAAPAATPAVGADVTGVNGSFGESDEKLFCQLATLSEGLADNGTVAKLKRGDALPVGVPPLRALSDRGPLLALMIAPPSCVACSEDEVEVEGTAMGVDEADAMFCCC